MLQIFSLLIKTLLDPGILLFILRVQFDLSLLMMVLEINLAGNEIQDEKNREDNGRIVDQVIKKLESGTFDPRILNDGYDELVAEVCHEKDKIDDCTDYAYKQRVFEKLVHQAFSSPFASLTNIWCMELSHPPKWPMTSKDEPHEVQFLNALEAAAPQFGHTL